MSYLWIALIGAVTGLVAGRFVTGSHQEMVVDAVAGAVGAWLLVVVFRLVVADGANGFLVSAIVAITGALASLFAMNRFMQRALIEAPRSRRRM